MNQNLNQKEILIMYKEAFFTPAPRRDAMVPEMIDTVIDKNGNRFTGYISEKLDSTSVKVHFKYDKDIFHVKEALK